MDPEQETTEQATPEIQHRVRDVVPMCKGMVTVTLMILRDITEGEDQGPLGTPNAAAAVTEFSVPTQYLTPFEVATLIGQRAGRHLAFGEDIIDSVMEQVRQERAGGETGDAEGEDAGTERRSHQDFQA